MMEEDEMLPGAFAKALLRELERKLEVVLQGRAYLEKAEAAPGLEVKTFHVALGTGLYPPAIPPAVEALARAVKQALGVSRRVVFLSPRILPGTQRISRFLATTVDSQLALDNVLQEGKVLPWVVVISVQFKGRKSSL